MARTVVAIYDDVQAANIAVRDLVENGFPRDIISLVTNDTQNLSVSGGAAALAQPVAVVKPINEKVQDESGSGAGVGAGIGAAIGGVGGLLVGLGALTIPGLGPVLAAGPIAVALSTLMGAGVGAAAGGMTGGLLGALIGLGIPEEEAEFLVQGVQRGAVLLTAQVQDQRADEIVSILDRHHPTDIHQHAAR